MSRKDGDTPTPGVKTYTIVTQIKRFRFWPSFFPFGRFALVMEKEADWAEASYWADRLAEGNDCLSVTVFWNEPEPEV